MAENDITHIPRVFRGGTGRAILLVEVLALLLLVPGTGYAQNTLIQQRRSGDVQVFVDTIGYMYPKDPSQTFVEILYAFDRSQMTFIELPDSPGVLSAAWDIYTTIETEVGDFVTAQQWYRVTYDSTRAGAEANQTIYDRYPDLLLKPGVYRITTTITDLNSKLSDATRIGVDERTVVVSDYSKSDLTISDIEFATRLGKAASENMFVKNGLQVIPNPLRIYGVNLPLLSFYAEIYGLADSTGTGSFTQQVTIQGLNVDYRRVYEKRTKTIRGRNDLFAQTGFNVSVFPPGDYRLTLEVVDEVTGKRSVREKVFGVLGAATTAPESGSTLETVPMTPENVQRFRDEITYLASDRQLATYDSLDVEGKRRFLVSFWQEQATRTGASVSEVRSTWEERFDYVNKNFTSQTQPAGWKTDQGRIWLLYGKPDDVVPHPEVGTGTKPWVEWDYNQMGQEGRVRFIFADLSGGFGTYRLIHSTHKGEVSNPNWQELVGVTGTDIPPAPILR